jgi:hypothetical protein
LFPKDRPQFQLGTCFNWMHRTISASVQDYRKIRWYLSKWIKLEDRPWRTQLELELGQVGLMACISTCTCFFDLITQTIAWGLLLANSSNRTESIGSRCFEDWICISLIQFIWSWAKLSGKIVKLHVLCTDTFQAQKSGHFDFDSPGSTTRADTAAGSWLIKVSLPQLVQRVLLLMNVLSIWMSLQKAGICKPMWKNLKIS